MKSDFLEVGVITRPHGIRGELKLRLHNESSAALRHVQSVTLGLPGRSEQRVEVLSVRGGGRELIVKLEQCASREAAEGLRGAKVLVERSSLPALEADDYYLIDLIGCEVRCGSRSVGRVTGLRSDPTVDTLLLERAEGGRVEQPLLDAWVGEFDQENGVLELKSEDGLID